MPKIADTDQTPVRVRFAPSPTGFLHVGGARTAIYNELLRQSRGGASILRIEDTDRERSDEAMTRQITTALSWLGVEHDEGPFLQSERRERHRELVGELLKTGRAYRCFCTPEELAEERQKVEKGGLRFRYPGTCRNLPEIDVRRKMEDRVPYVVRFLMPEEAVVVEDLVRGDVTFEPDVLDDFILLRSDGSPTYHMSVVSDDMDMEVTHVIRGEDHLSNTPKHVPLFRALGATVPRFAHLPLILGTDKKRLSKRTGATSVEEFRSQGILPQALYNYLALLGWSPGGDRELMTREEMIDLFTVERLNSSAAVFDPEKLAWVNAQYMSSLPLDEILRHARPFLDEAGLGALEGGDVERLEGAVDLHRQRAKNLAELTGFVSCYFEDRIDYEAVDDKLTRRFREDPGLPEMVETLRRRYREIDSFEIDPLDQALRDLAEELEVKAGALIHPLRMALTGTKAGPPVFDVVAAMGRDATARHLAQFADYLRAHPIDPDESPDG
jgi:glutamyl-tRNA synthetase